MESQARRGRVVKVGVMRLLILEGSTARPPRGSRGSPIADDVEHLLGGDPVERALNGRLEGFDRCRYRILGVPILDLQS